MLNTYIENILRKKEKLKKYKYKKYIPQCAIFKKSKSTEVLYSYSLNAFPGCSAGCSAVALLKFTTTVTTITTTITTTIITTITKLFLKKTYLKVIDKVI